MKPDYHGIQTLFLKDRIIVNLYLNNPNLVWVMNQ